MQEWKLEVSFATPAFLGDAQQQGAWRTPPFKALLRHWWRIAAAKECGYDVNALREREKLLFGAASDDKKKKFGKSKVRLRLGEWKKGSGKDWKHLPKVCHPEVDLSRVSSPKARQAAFCQEHSAYHRIHADVYLGFGPVGLGGITKPPYINVNENGEIGIVAPEALTDAVRLMAWFGTLGSRSRNGWGSLMATANNIAPVDAVLNGSADLRPFSRSLEECLQLDWPHAFGTDEKGKLLIWKSKQSFAQWEQAMKYLAEVKIAFRTHFKFARNKKENPVFEDRHVLAYPVTNHPVEKWGTQERMANQICFKVVKSDGKFHALVYHLPCAIPSELKKKLGSSAPSHRKQEEIWHKVHCVLDKKMDRLGGPA